MEFEAEVTRSKAVTEVELAWRRRDLQTEIFETQLKVAALSQEKLNKQVEQIAWREHLMSVDVNVDSVLSDIHHPFRSISLEVNAPDDRRLQAMLREDAAAASAESLAAQIALCEQRLKKLELLEKEIEKQVRASSGIDVAETRFNGAKQELAALESQLKELTMTSPTYGTIGDVKLQPGDRVPSGGTLVEILDDQQPHIVTQIPSSAASKPRQGSQGDAALSRQSKADRNRRCDSTADDFDCRSIRIGSCDQDRACRQTLAKTRHRLERQNSMLLTLSRVSC